MNKRLFLFFVVVAVLVAGAFLLDFCLKPDVPIPTPTKVITTVVPPTKTPVVTEMPPTKTPKPTKTLRPTATPKPTLTPTPTVAPDKALEVYTGWKFGLDFYPEGMLHFRDGPGVEFYPIWWYGDRNSIIGGWLKEGTILQFVECTQDNNWAVVLFQGVRGYVKAEYIKPRLCEGE